MYWCSHTRTHAKRPRKNTNAHTFLHQNDGTLDIVVCRSGCHSVIAFINDFFLTHTLWEHVLLEHSYKHIGNMILLTLRNALVLLLLLLLSSALSPTFGFRNGLYRFNAGIVSGLSGDACGCSRTGECTWVCWVGCDGCRAAPFCDWPECPCLFNKLKTTLPFKKFCFKFCIVIYTLKSFVKWMHVFSKRRFHWAACHQCI